MELQPLMGPLSIVRGTGGMILTWKNRISTIESSTSATMSTTNSVYAALGENQSFQPRATGNSLSCGRSLWEVNLAV